RQRSDEHGLEIPADRLGIAGSLKKACQKNKKLRACNAELFFNSAACKLVRCRGCADWWFSTAISSLPAICCAPGTGWRMTISESWRG
ncbi:MAG TPA: hypothetical protein VMX16_11705, partial [Terriglobia bacterium]|nr:hypothetical protein [Terriglobia bacterium]